MKTVFFTGSDDAAKGLAEIRDFRAFQAELRPLIDKYQANIAALNSSYDDTLTTLGDEYDRNLVALAERHPRLRIGGSCHVQ